jgi:CheY-like chemotaxis protein
MANKSVNLVLLVDDNDTDNFISKRIIEITKFADKVIVKNSGKSALEYLESAQNNEAELPDVIFLDINMPIVDGFVFLFEFEMFPDNLKQKRDIAKIVDNEYVIKFITKPLTEKALQEIQGILAEGA